MLYTGRGAASLGVYAAGASAHTHQPVRVTHLQCGGRCACKPTLPCQVCKPVHVHTRWPHTSGAWRRTWQGGHRVGTLGLLSHPAPSPCQSRSSNAAWACDGGYPPARSLPPGSSSGQSLLGHEARRLLPLTQPPPQPGQMLRAYTIRQRRPMRSGPTALATPQTRRHQVLTSSGPGPSMIVAKSRRQIDVRSPDRYPTAARESSRMCWRAWRRETAPHSAAHRLKTTAQRTRTHHHHRQLPVAS